MNCQDYEILINRMIDGEMSADDSRAVFSHLASCGQCRAFYHQLQLLGVSLDHIEARLEVPGEASRVGRKAYPENPARWWVRQVSLRVPVFAVLVAALFISLYFSFSSAVRVRPPEVIYVTQLPPITVTAEAVPAHFMKRGVHQ